MKTNLSSCCNAEVSKVEVKNSIFYTCTNCSCICGLVSPRSLKEEMMMEEAIASAELASPEVIEKWDREELTKEFKDIYYQKINLNDRGDPITVCVDFLISKLSTQEKELREKAIKEIEKLVVVYDRNLQGGYVYKHKVLNIINNS